MKEFCCILVLLGCGLLCSSVDAADASNDPLEQVPRTSRGFGTEAARVDSQITLKIPGEQAAAVYAYLREAYADSNRKLAAEFPGLGLHGDESVDVSMFTDQYFDTPDLELYKRQSSVRYRQRVNTTNPADRKSGRELVQLKITPHAGFEMRTELKFPVKYAHKKRDQDDLHPLLGLIDGDHREDFKQAIRSMGLQPLALQPVMTIRQRRSRVYIYWGKENILSFSVDEYKTRVLWATAENSSVDIGLVENVFTEADATKRMTLQSIREYMVRDLKARFPGLEQATAEKYRIMLDELVRQVPLLRFLIRHRLI